MNQKVAKALQQVQTMVIQQDYHSAAQKLLEIQSLYPSIGDQIGSMLSVCEVLSAAKFSHPGCGVDHYWVLNASHFFNLSDLTSHYHRITDSLKPLTTTKFPGAERALDLVERAFSVVSDAQKRLRYDSARNASRRSPQEYRMVSLDSRAMPECDSGLVNETPCQDYYNFESDREFGLVEEGQIWAAKYGASSAHNHRYAQVSFASDGVACLTWLRPIPSSPSERMWCDSGLPVSCGSFELGPETTCELSWSTMASHQCPSSLTGSEGRFDIYPQRGEVWAIYRIWDIHEWPRRGLDCLKECALDFVVITSEFSKYNGVDCACLVKVDGFRHIYERKRVQRHIGPAMFYIFVHKVPTYRFIGGEMSGVVEGMFELDRFALADTLTTQKLSSCKPCRDQDGYFLKPHWSSSDLSTGQIWAVCCGNHDSMPRQYARVDQVVSDSQICVTFLEALTERNKENPPAVCGVFKVSGSSLYLGVSNFSYLVNYRRKIDTFFEIHPRKGEVWAMWSEGREYEVVQILSDFWEGDETRIGRLEEVKGCLTFFQKQQRDGFYLTGLVSNKELVRFSHRIPAFRVPGIGRHGIPESTWHLEPKALPPKPRLPF